jgi:hypothetical protein
MSGNGTLNNSFVAGNALPSALHTGTNSGMITNGMQSRSIGGKRRSVSKRMHGGETLDDELARLNTSLRLLRAKSPKDEKGEKFKNEFIEKWSKRIKEIKEKLGLEGGKKPKSHKNRKTSRKTKKWFGLF